jgi:hypothetical protein
MSGKSTFSKRLSTMKKTMKTKSGMGRISDAQTLYLSALTAVVIPVLSAGPVVQSTQTEIKPSNNSVVVDNTIYICQSTMEIVQQKVLQRTELMDSISNVDAKVFCSTGKR